APAAPAAPRFPPPCATHCLCIPAQALVFLRRPPLRRSAAPPADEFWADRPSPSPPSLHPASRTWYSHWRGRPAAPCPAVHSTRSAHEHAPPVQQHRWPHPPAHFAPSPRLSPVAAADRPPAGCSLRRT